MDPVRARVDGELTLLALDPRPGERLRKAFSLNNPKYLNHKRFGGWGENPEPRQIECLVEMPDRSVHLPRGSIAIVKQLLALDGYTVSVTDDRRARGVPFLAPRIPDLRDYQTEGVALWARHTQGLISLPPGTGKTRLGVGAILTHPVTTLVLVPSGDIADQWLEALAACGVTGGKVGGGSDQRFFDVVVGIVDSVANILRVDPVWGQRFGRVIADEAHRVSAPTWQGVLRLLSARFRLALSATPNRDDGMGPLVQWTFGPTLLVRSIKQMIDFGYLMPATISFVQTNWTFVHVGPEKKKISAMDAALALDVGRNTLIANRTAKEALAGRTCLVLVRTKGHAKILAQMITDRGAPAVALTGDTAKSKRKSSLDDLRKGRLAVGVGTSLLNEGVDLPRLDFIALASPQRARGTTIQRLGRLLRLWEGKKPHLVDFVDGNVPTLASRARDRERTFRETGLLL